MPRTRTLAPPAELTFTEPMECLAVSALPTGRDWTYEIKLDGYRCQPVHTLDSDSYSTTPCASGGNDLPRP